VIFPIPVPQPLVMTAPLTPVSDVQQEIADAPSPTAPSLPDRADAPVSEVCERFLRAVMAEIPLSLLEELHLFSPLRQGTVETGIAVLAVRVPEVVAASELSAAGEPTEPELALEALAEAQPEEPLGDPADRVPVETLVDEASDDEDISRAGAPIADPTDDEQGEGEAVERVPLAPTIRPVRHTVYTARYRYVIKGPERGKWESSLKAEADAPLVTVETVVRGVQRRAGEESEIIRYTAAQVAKILRVPVPAASVAE
jgi:hypothetical protein